MKNESSTRIYRTKIITITFALILALVAGCAASGSKTAEQSSAAGSSQVARIQPMDIPQDVSCGKCGMYPAKYPRWQSQITYKDGTMTPFDGCKCMFNFMNAMAQYDKAHSRDDISVIWVKDFNSGKWVDAAAAYYVVGSSMMGPMGKELIPFADKAEAMKFHQEQGGAMMIYTDITPEVLKSLMGDMKGQGHMKM